MTLIYSNEVGVINLLSFKKSVHSDWLSREYKYTALIAFIYNVKYRYVITFPSSSTL